MEREHDLDLVLAVLPYRCAVESEVIGTILTFEFLDTNQELSTKHNIQELEPGFNDVPSPHIIKSSSGNLDDTASEDIGGGFHVRKVLVQRFVSKRNILFIQILHKKRKSLTNYSNCIIFFSNPKSMSTPKDIKVTIKTKITEVNTDPPIKVVTITTQTPEGLWPVTFGSVEKAEGFLLGLQVMSSTLGRRDIDILPLPREMSQEF